jgi:hypothetical protein
MVDTHAPDKYLIKPFGVSFWNISLPSGKFLTGANPQFSLKVRSLRCNLGNIAKAAYGRLLQRSVISDWP